MLFKHPRGTKASQVCSHLKRFCCAPVSPGLVEVESALIEAAERLLRLLKNNSVRFVFHMKHSDELESPLCLRILRYAFLSQLVRSIKLSFE